MSRDLLLELTRRTVAHAKAQTVPLADAVAQVPAANYYDPDRWHDEMERIFRRLPLVLGFSCEFAEPNSYKAMEVAGVPVLLTRAGDGPVQGFVNMCSHRGAIVVAEGAGIGRRFTCPYHGWSYNGEGTLVGILDRREFGEIDRDELGLIPLPVVERAGIVFGGLTPDTSVAVDSFLCGYGEVLELLDLAGCTFVGSQSVEGPNWKVAYDGYLDFYHLPILHKDSFGPDLSNKAIYDAWGPHQRVSSPDRRMRALDDRPEEDWPHELLTAGVWTIFPHTSIAGFSVKDANGDGGTMYMVSTLFPGPEPDTSITVQNFLAAFDPPESLEPTITAQKDFLLGVVRDEDYFTGQRIGRALKTGARGEVIFGRNEAGGQRFHRWVDDLLAADDDDDLVSLFAQAESDFQR